MAIFYTDSASFENITVAQNLTVLGTSSVAYATELNVGNNIIKLGNNQLLRYAGLDFVDSGSTPITSASLYFDSTKNEMVYLHNGGVTSSVLLLGPETYNDFGNEIYLTQNRLPKGTGIEHLVDSNITDTGTLVSIVGPLSASGGITGSGFRGTASFAVSASWAPSSPSVSASYAETASFAISASWAPGGQQGAAFPYDGSTVPAVITGSAIVSGSMLLGNVKDTSVLDPTAPESLYISSSNINAAHIHGNLNDYIQVTLMNDNSGTNASADFVAEADNATEFGNFIDMGINSSGYAGGQIGGPGDGYVYITSSVG